MARKPKPSDPDTLVERSLALVASLLADARKAEQQNRAAYDAALQAFEARAAALQAQRASGEGDEVVELADEAVVALKRWTADRMFVLNVEAATAKYDRSKFCET